MERRLQSGRRAHERDSGVEGGEQSLRVGRKIALAVANTE